MSRPIPLLDALLDARCVPASAPLAERKNCALAMERLWLELQRLAPRVLRTFSLDSDATDEAISRVAMNIAKTGPRRSMTGQPTTEAAARAYLRRSLHNRAVDLFRKSKRTSKREESLDGLVGESARSRHELLADPDAQTGEEALANAEALQAQQALVSATDTWIDQQTAALVARKNRRRSGTGTQLQETLALLARAAAGELTVDDHVAKHCDPGADAKTLKKTRNAIDARFKRARRALDDWISLALEREPEIDKELARALLRTRVSLQ
ncbi:MAG: hypothetical protein KC502_08950 [Myxococcales bacterium]|nr:hypothetical protein [Myxococcales bacterium]